MRLLARHLRPLPFLLFAALAGCQPTAGPANPSALRIDLQPAAGAVPDRFVVAGLSARQLAEIEKLDSDARAAIFRVFVANDQVDPAPLVGRWSIEDQQLCFTPGYPLVPGLTYQAIFSLSDRPALRGANPSAGNSAKEKGVNLPGEVSASFAIPSRAAQPPAAVERIYPTADLLPENQLKFYIHFSAPMSRGEAYRHVHLLDGAGQEVEAAFLELGEELWDPQMRRFTLLCDPGRVKQGLKPREELGPVLEEGKSYTLVIDADWPDANGARLSAAARKEFQVGAPDDRPVDTSLWKIIPPRAGTSEPLVVHFPKPLDQALLERVVWVTNAAGERIDGTIHTSEQETLWQFAPSQSWAAGLFHLVAGTTLEDLAGNSIGRAFDVDVFGPIQNEITTEITSIDFTVAATAE